ncbi:MAG: DUF3800 domain-containing protein [Akkermansia sp.]
MSYLLFMDESGHDHKKTPYEIHGGIALDCKKIFSVVREIMDMEKEVFGCQLKEYKVELKGTKLLKKDTFKWAQNYTDKLTKDERQRHVRRFLTAALEKKSPTKRDFYAYGQAKLLFVDRALEIMRKNDVKIFASAIPLSVQKPRQYTLENFLRKDLVFLFQRYAQFLKGKNTNGLILLDRVEKVFDSKFTKQVHNYFLKTVNGRNRSKYIVPEPLFVDSVNSYFIELADLCIYLLNWGYRKNCFKEKNRREELVERYESLMGELIFYFDSSIKLKRSCSLVFTNSPYGK